MSFTVDSLLGSILLKGGSLAAVFLLSASVEASSRGLPTEGYREAKLEAKASGKPPRSTSGTAVEPKIVGGDNSKVDAYPWMAGVLERGESDRYFAQYCGGALIHPYWVLTAAHCVEGLVPEEIDVLIGARDLSLSGEGERIEVVEIIMHPDFDPFTLDADAALLRLATPSTAPVLRVNSDSLAEMPGLLATILGWGSLNSAGTLYPDILQEAQVPLVDFSTANTIWGDTLTPYMIAAGNLAEGGVDTCQGDSGGPLIVRDFDDAWTLVGLTSFGDGCAEPDSPGIYTRVSQIRPWLLPIIAPRYAEWEATWGVLGESRDSDGDGRSHFEEFAFATNPLVADGSSLRAEIVDAAPTFAFRRPVGAAAALAYTVNYRSSLEAVPLRYDLEAQVLETVPDGAEELVRANFPAGEQGFVSIEAAQRPAVAPSIRPVAFPGSAFSTINADLPQDSFNRFYQEFTFPGQPLGEPVNYLGRSDSFDMILEIYDPATGILLAVSDSNSAGGRNEQLTFTATTIPVIRVISGDGLGGSFELTGFVDVVSDGQIGPGETLNGELTTSDELDDIYAQSGDYYKRDYLLVLPDAFTGSLTITLLSDDFDAYLILLDALTGHVIAENDDIDFAGGNRNARLILDTAAYRHVLIRVSTAEVEETGSFTLIVD
ncbi:MAG: serine protease [Puniceicoccaceae bacterium]|nr:MAG: serine protease [Puniceicoccaceae bacterium]